jgi:hypothetical protein
MKIVPVYGSNFNKNYIQVSSTPLKHTLEVRMINRTIEDIELNSRMGWNIVAIFRIFLKKPVLALALLLMSFGASAHIGTQECTGNGLIEIVWTNLSLPNKVKITYGSYDTTIIATAVPFTTIFKAPTQATNITFAFSDGYTTTLYLGYDNCDLPIELTYFQASTNNLGVLFSWQTAMETNNSYFEVQKSDDGGVTWDKVLDQNSLAAGGNSDITLTYFAQATASQAASANNIAIVWLSLAIIVFVWRNRKMIFAVALMATMASCTKTSVSAIKSNIQKTQYRLEQVDLNGNHTYSQIIFVS